MNKFFPALNDELLNKITDLTEQCAIAEDGQYPDGITLGETKILPSTPESQLLQATINSLPQDGAQDLSALMYLGRDGVENQSVAEAVEWLRDDASKRPDSDNKRSLAKVPLASYLKKGKELMLTA